MRKFSHQQLMQFLFNEASPILKTAIDNALVNDVNLQREIESLQSTKNKLNELKKETVSPSQATIDSILDYAKKTSVKK